QLAVAPVTDQASIFHDDATTENRRYRPALDRPALPGAVVAHVEVLLRERLLDARIDDRDVRVAPGSDDTLARVETQDPRGVRGGHLGEALERHPAFDDALGIDDHHPRLG